ncbi:LA_0991 family prenyltransferase-like protein [Leptospira yasudae]|uniref:LA_0991 family prenyltransferase-like protein n=1 Tax=Leptospira yasudae TaxID=2202201 RepID=UPI00109115C5|nr:hypothetical protein [Leptospira yasudae]TGN01617.1 hypothetical protein EHR10_08380 [Leptospira yasudae]
MKDSFFKDAFYYWNVLSVDIVCGAVASAWFVSSLLHTQMRTAFWILLPASVWVIYSADHLIDGWKLGENSANERHAFHYKNRIFLSWITMIAAVLCFVCGILFLREWVVNVALILGIFVFLHVVFSYLQISFFWKECSVSVLYTAGVWFGPILLTQKSAFETWTPCALFFLTALCNSFVNSYMEKEIDRKENVESILKQISPVALKKTVYTLAAIGAAGILFWFRESSEPILPESLYLGLGYAIPAGILWLESSFQKNRFYRLFGEGYFILACIPVLIRRWVTV